MESEPDSYHVSLFLFIIPLTAIPALGVAAAFASIVILLLCSAFISSSEVAFFSLTPNDLDRLKQENTPATQRIIGLVDEPRSLLATILICNNFINIAIVILSDFIFRKVFPIEISENIAQGIINLFSLTTTKAALGGTVNFTITVVGVTFLLVLFGEVAPKVYAKINNIKLAKMMSGSLLKLSKIFRPLSGLLIKGTSLIENRLAKRSQNGSITSKEDIDNAIELTVRDEIGAKQDIDILKGIVKFGEVSVKQIMRSRVDVIAVDFQIGFLELMKVIRDSGYSRIPVFNEDFDNVTGILYIKDLLAHIEEDNKFEWQAFIRPNVLYVPEAKKISDLLKDFQTQRLHMAVVVDEYGGSSGIVSLEDIMEEVIGDIRDEFDDEIEVEYEKIDDYNFIFEGKTLLNDVCRIIGIDTNTFDEVKGDADSVAGMILEIIGHIPKVGKEVVYEQYRFKIVAVNKRRVEQIRITLP